MALSHSPSIVTNGLVFAYDMANTQKSWKGKPTTNLITNPNSGINVTSTNVPSGVPVTGYSSFNTGYNVIDWTVPSTAATGVTFTYSVYMRSTGGTSTYLMYVYTGTGPDGGWFSAGSGALTDSWQRFTFTSGSWTGNITILRVYRFNQLGTIELAAPQLEVNSFATPFVNGTRSTTQAILDQTNNNTITATSLTYANDNTFSWSAGIDARLQSPSSSNFAFGTGDFTLECWINPVNFNGYTHMVAMPDQNTFALKANSGDGAIYFYSPGFTTYPTSGWTLTSGTWNHVILTRSSSVSYSYLNGQLKGSKAGFSNSFSAQILNIGNGWPSEYTTKQISSVKIYNRALSAAEVQQNFNALRGRYSI